MGSGNMSTSGKHLYDGNKNVSHRAAVVHSCFLVGCTAHCIMDVSAEQQEVVIPAAAASEPPNWPHLL